MPTLDGIFDWVQSQALILYSIFVIITVGGIIWKKAWFSGLWIILGMAVFGYFLNSPDALSSISSSVSGLLGW
jgi:hypothetical protein